MSETLLRLSNSISFHPQNTYINRDVLFELNFNLGRVELGYNVVEGIEYSVLL